jgi:hypothetical protein
MVSNGTYEITNQLSGLALSAGGTSDGSAVTQQTYTSAATQIWNVTNLGGNVVELTVSGTNEALEVPGGSDLLGIYLDVSTYTGATSQQWTLISEGGGYYDISNVNSHYEGMVANSTAGDGVYTNYTGPYTQGYWTFISVGSGGGGGGGSPPSAPTGLGAIAGNVEVSLSWSAGSGATSYNVYRGTSSGGESSTAIATGITSTSYNDTSVTNGTTYYYKVAALNSSGTSAYSNEASATPSSGSSYLVPNGTYEITNQLSGLALSADGVSNGSAVTQQTYSSATTQKWTVTNLGGNMVELTVSGTSAALEVPGGSDLLGVYLDVSSYTGATSQQWTLVSEGSGDYDIVNVNSGHEATVADGTAGDGVYTNWAGPYTNGYWTFTPH